MTVRFFHQKRRIDVCEKGKN